MSHEVYIHRCLQLAQMGRGEVSPNPMVGAVLVYDGRIIGEGWHQQYGMAHAEVHCLNNVSEADKPLIPDSTMYVSLEPCAHHGKTPPCANRLVAEGIKQVVICNTDPFAQVAGKGITILKDAGIAVTTGILAHEGRWINRRFFCAQELQRPYIILKWAQTSDGYIAPVDGSRLQISNPQSQALVHRWRAEEDAIMVGSRTAMNDNPRLTARLWQGNNPLRIVLDKNLSLPENLHLFDDEADTWILNNKQQNTKGNLQQIQLDFTKDILPQLLQNLHGAGKQSLIVEGGAVLLQSFIVANLWDEARVFIAEKKMQQGISAPVLNTQSAITTELLTDKLEMYTNPASNYPFVKGYDL